VRVGDGSIVSECIVRGADSAGLNVCADCVIKDTTVRNSGFTGMATGSAAVVRGCVSSGNGQDNANTQQAAGRSVNPRTGEPLGAAARDWSVVADREGDKHVGMPDAGTEGANAGPDGFALGAGGVITGSTARNNAEDGISADTGSRIENCTARDNGENGVHIGLRTTVYKCTSDSTFVGGITVEGSDNRIDSNTITNNNEGIVLNGGFNRVVRNDLSINGSDIMDNSGGGNNLPPEDDFTNPWTNFTD